MNANAYIHAGRSFEYDNLASFTRGLLKRTSLRAAADGTIKGVTVREVDEALKAANIRGEDAIAIKLDLKHHGIMRNL